MIEIIAVFSVSEKDLQKIFYYVILFLDFRIYLMG
jgi:hypothetical protein